MGEVATGSTAIRHCSGIGFAWEVVHQDHGGVDGGGYPGTAALVVFARKRGIGVVEGTGDVFRLAHVCGYASHKMLERRSWHNQITGIE